MSSFIKTPSPFLTARFFYINEPIAVMRKHPTDSSKVVSQALFSEKITVEKKEKEWAYIMTSDHYPGWIKSSALIELKDIYKPTLRCSRLAAHLYNEKDTEFGPFKTIPYGSGLQAIETSDPRWIEIALLDGKKSYIQRGDVALEKKLHHKNELVKFSHRFMGLPYTWGGRSSFGYDCSGFVQMLYRQIQIDLPRDASQQMVDERFKTISLEKSEAGDLVFFSHSSKKMHVGICLDKERFIHASSRENQPWIRISRFLDFEWSAQPKAFYSHRFFRQWIKL